MKKLDFKKPYSTIEITFKTSDWLAVYSCYSKIESLIAQNKDVPAQLLKDLHNFLHDLDEAKEHSISAEAYALSTKAADYFSTQKDFDFNGKSLQLIFRFQIPSPKQNKKLPEKGYVTYNLKDIFYNCVKSYLRSKDTIVTKDGMIRFFYSEIKTYKKTFSKSHQRQLTHYRLSVISAYLTHICGFKLTTQEKLTNSLLFQSSRNALKSKSPE